MISATLSTDSVINLLYFHTQHSANPRRFQAGFIGAAPKGVWARRASTEPYIDYGSVSWRVQREGEEGGWLPKVNRRQL